MITHPQYNTHTAYNKIPCTYIQFLYSTLVVVMLLHRRRRLNVRRRTSLCAALLLRRTPGAPGSTRTHQYNTFVMFCVVVWVCANVQNQRSKFKLIAMIAHVFAKKKSESFGLFQCFQVGTVWEFSIFTHDVTRKRNYFNQIYSPYIFSYQLVVAADANINQLPSRHRRRRLSGLLLTLANIQFVTVRVRKSSVTNFSSSCT